MLFVQSAIEIAADLGEVRAPANEDRADKNALVKAYYELRDRSIRERDAGNLQEVLSICDGALALANQIGDDALIDQAYCNRFGVALALGRTDISATRLREILMCNRSLRTSYTAAHHLACQHTTQKQYKKALFYSHIAQHRAYALHDSSLIALSHNEIGRCYLAESHFEKAVEEYESALAVLPEEKPHPYVAALGNLGYAKLLLRDYRAGFACLYRCLQHCRRYAAQRAYQECVHLQLCFGYIELRRWRYAWHHGISALNLAEKKGNLHVIKNALYLLGEVEKSAGDLDAAHHYFSRLKRDFYPDNADLVRFMLYYETKDLVNLWA